MGMNGGSSSATQPFHALHLAQVVAVEAVRAGGSPSSTFCR